MSSPLPVRVAIVNDYPIVVAGLALVLHQYRHRVRVVEVDTGRLVRSEVDIVLCDTFARSTSTIPGIAELATRTGAKVVLFTADTTPHAIASARQLGAAGCISKAASPRELVELIEAVDRGEDVSPAAETTVEVQGAGDWPGRELLSHREAEVLALIAQGYSNDQIAGRLFLSINSVKTYIRTAYRKMGVERRTQAVLWAIDHGFTPQATRLVDPLDGVPDPRSGH